MDRGHEIHVLDRGYVRLVDWMGSDESIVEAARTSTGRRFVSWDPYQRCWGCSEVFPLDGRRVRCRCDVDFEKFPRGDLGILDYLYRNRHTTPFEMCELVIDVKVPMDCWRQWIRHRTASVNEYSTRYSEAIDEAAATEPGAWRTQGTSNRQGSGAFLAVGSNGIFDSGGRHGDTDGHRLSNREVRFHREAREVYEERLKAGVAKEQARKDLPLSTYTAARWKCDLKNTLHFLGLRMHEHAQWEIRQYACAVAEIVKAIWPRTYALFEEYDLCGVRLSRSEVEVLRRVFRDAGSALDDKEAALRDRIGGAK